MWVASLQVVSTNASTLSDLLYLTYPTLISKQQYTLFGAPFIADYQAAHDDRYPFLDPDPVVRWTFAQTNQTTLDKGIINNKTIFMNWWNSEVVKTDLRLIWRLAQIICCIRGRWPCRIVGMFI